MALAASAGLCAHYGIARIEVKNSATRLKPRTDKMIAASVQWAELTMRKIDSVYS
jgi:hypothetical protein